jgi:hypothetical protein
VRQRQTLTSVGSTASVCPTFVYHRSGAAQSKIVIRVHLCSSVVPITCLVPLRMRGVINRRLDVRATQGLARDVPGQIRFAIRHCFVPSGPSLNGHAKHAPLPRPPPSQTGRHQTRLTTPPQPRHPGPYATSDPHHHPPTSPSHNGGVAPARAINRKQPNHNRPSSVTTGAFFTSSPLSRRLTRQHRRPR